MTFSVFAWLNVEKSRSTIMQRAVIITRKSLVVSINKQSITVPAAFMEHF